MISKVVFIGLLLVASAQQHLNSVPSGCSIPKSPPTCVYSTATPYFKSCGIYNGGDCPRFCHSLQAQHWARQSPPRRCFRFTPSLIILQRIHSFCMYRCAYAKRRIRQYRITGRKKAAFNASRIQWKASNIKALIYLSVSGRGFVTNRVQVYTTNARISGSRSVANCLQGSANFGGGDIGRFGGGGGSGGDGSSSDAGGESGTGNVSGGAGGGGGCGGVGGGAGNLCICSSCWRYGASCPRCCRFSGHIWV